jgi:hypothetical protein
MPMALTVSTCVSCAVHLCRPLKCPLRLGWLVFDRALETVGLYGHLLCACFEMEINLPCLRILFHDEILLNFIYQRKRKYNAHRKDVETEDCSLARDQLHNIRSCIMLTLYSSLL